MKLKSILALSALGLSLAGCGTSGKSVSSVEPSKVVPSSTAKSSAVPSSEASSKEGSSSISKPDVSSVTIDFWHTFGDAIETTMLSVIDEFIDAVKATDNVDVTVNFDYKGGYDDVANNIQSGISTGEVPTLAVAYPDHIATYLRSETTPGSLVVNLEPYMNDKNIGFGTEEAFGDIEKGTKYLADDIVENFLEEGGNYYRDGYYSLPFMKSSEVMFYNLEAVSKVLAAPKYNITGKVAIEQFMSNLTWDKLIELASDAKAAKSKTQLQNLEYPIYYDSDGNFMISKMFQEEIAYSHADANGKGVIDFETGENRTKTEALLTSISQNYADGLLITKGINGTYGSTNFTEEKSIFSIGSTGGTGYNVPQGETFTVGVCKVPESNENPLYVSQGPTLTMLRSSKISKEENDARNYYAWKLLKFLTNPEYNLECTLNSKGYLPIRYSTYSSDAFIELMSREDNIYGQTYKVMLNEISGNYFYSEAFPGSSDLRAAMSNVIANVCKQSVPVSTAITNAINTAKNFIN